MSTSNRPASALVPEGDDHAAPSTAPARSGARFLRRQLKGPAALAVRRGAHAAGVSYQQLGLVIDAPKSRVGRMASGTHDDVIDLVRARLAPPATAKELARFVLEPHGALVVDAPAVVECSEAERTYSLQKELLDVLNARAEHLRDGSHNLAEAEAELVELRQAIAKALEHEAHLVAKCARLRGGR